MNPHEHFCYNAACWADSRPGEERVVIHSRRERRYRCRRCGQTFAAARGTALH